MDDIARLGRGDSDGGSYPQGGKTRHRDAEKRPAGWQRGYRRRRAS